MPAGGVYTFVRSPREAAEVAIGLAGGNDVDLFSASIGGQLLRAGLVDEVRIPLAPVLLGAGTRLLDDDGHIRLHPTRITESSKATHLRYQVLSARSVPGLSNSCHQSTALSSSGSRPREPASGLHKMVGDTGIEPVTSSVSTVYPLPQPPSSL